MSITVNNPTALSWKHPGVGGISTRDGVITEWPDSLPELTQDYVDSIEAEWTASEGHKAKRRAAYPTWEQQMDDLYHNGITGWSANIKKIKDQYPKA